MKSISKVRKTQTPAKCRTNAGRFRKGVSGNPKGKKRGTKNKRTAWNELLIPIHDDLFGVICEQALEGCRASQRLLAERIWSPLRSVSLPLPLGVGTDGDAILKAVQTGTIDPDTAKILLDMLLTRAKISEFTDLERRIRALEKENG